MAATKYLEGTRYVVKKNDSLWDLASKFLGDHSKWPLIYQHNNSAEIIKLTGTSIPEQDVIYIGQVLYIPPKNTNIAISLGTAIRYVHFKSKAKEFSDHKNSFFLKGFSAPVTSIRLDQVVNLSQAEQKNAKRNKELAVRLKLARSISNEKINSFLTRIDNIPELTGTGVVYMDYKFTLVIVRPSIRQDRLAILIREVNKFDKLAIEANTNAASNKDVLWELLYAGLSCGSAVLGYIAIVGEGLAVPVSVGTSSLLIPITVAATAASSASCGIYIGRVINEFSGNAAYNTYLDDDVVYRHIMTALDLISLAGIVTTWKSSTTLIKQFKSKELSKQTLLQRLKAMPRVDRKRLLREMIKFENPDINKKQLKAILRSMDAPKIYSQAQIRKAMIGELIGVIGSTFSVGASVADGTINNLAVAFFADERID